MKELYRIFHYGNGFSLKVENVVDGQETQEGVLLTTVTGDKTFIKPGWVATTFRSVPVLPPAVAPQRDTDGDQTR